MRGTRGFDELIAMWINWQLVRRRAGLTGMAERLVVPTMPGNSGGGEWPQLKADARSDDRKGDWR
jgi:hypothetical protein